MKLRTKSAPKPAISFNNLSTKLGVRSLDSWYKITTRAVERSGGRGLLAQHSGAGLAGLLSVHLPSHRWLPWRFPQVPPRYWDSREHRLEFFKWASEQLEIRELADWYQIQGQDLAQLAPGGRGLLNRKYGGSLPKALEDLYPEHAWLPWRFDVVPKGFWDSQANRRRFFAWLEAKLGLSKEGWYNVSPSVVTTHGGASFFKRLFGGSLASALADAFPERNWRPWLFAGHSLPADYWLDPKHKQAFIQYLMEHFGISSPEEWQNVPLEGLRRLLRSVPSVAKLLASSPANNSAVALLKEFYSSAKISVDLSRLEEKEREQANRNLAPRTEEVLGTVVADLNPGQRAEFFNSIVAKQLGINNPEEWYSISPEQLDAVPGATAMLRQWFEGNLPKAIEDLIAPPTLDGKWQPWRFTGYPVPRGYWQSADNRRHFFESAARTLGLSNLDDWYPIHAQQVLQLPGGAMLTNYYNGALVDALLELFPNHTWKVWMFGRLPKSTWTSTSDLPGGSSAAIDLPAFVASLAEKLRIQHLEDWNNVSYRQLKQMGAVTVLDRHGGLFQSLQACYPHHRWEEAAIRGKVSKRAKQRLLQRTADKITPKSSNNQPS